MKSTWLVMIVAVASAGAWACGNKSSGDDDSGGSSSMKAGAGGGAGRASQGGSSGKGGTGGMAGAANGPAITTAPPTWMPPADCGGIGDLCPEGIFGCSTKSSCQLEGYVCIPSLANCAGLPSRTADTPYCAAYTCMTFEQASCFCTGEAGKVTPSCSSPAALAGLCAGNDASCTSMSCCDGLSCVETNGGKRCETPCKSGSDCSTGCCTDLYDTGVTICADMKACTTPCKKHGEACNGGDLDTPTDCCRGTCVQSDAPDYAGCRPTCNTSADCDTGCCVPFSNSSSGFCVDPKYCSCPADGEPCGQGVANCCTGMSCVGDNNGGFVCRHDCTTDADCAGGKCSPLSSNDGGICLSCAAGGAACGSDLQCCGNGVCADTGSGSYSCHPPCQTSADCGGGKCTMLPNNVGVCDSCAAVGATCSAGVPCCGSNVCSSMGGDYSCHAPCNVDADCGTGEACSGLTSGSGGICVPSSNPNPNPMCVALDGACSADVTCCSPLICAGTDTFTCHAQCVSDDDCPTNAYCAPLDSGNGSICQTLDICVSAGLTCGPGIPCCDGTCVTPPDSATGTCMP